MLATIGTSALTLVAATSGCPASVPNTNIGFWLQPYPGNTGNIYVSIRSDVTTNGALTCGFVITPGIMGLCVPMEIAKDAKFIYIVSDAASQKLIWDNALMGS